VITLRRIASLAILAAFVSTTVAAQGRAGGGTAITTCGQVVTTNAFLTRDLSCPGSHGIVVGASEITIDLKGFTLQGDRSQFHDGIHDEGGFDNVSIKNGVVRSFDIGVAAFPDADAISVSKLVASGNALNGINVGGASTKIQSSTTSGNGTYGIAVIGNSASVSSSTAAGNRFFGIEVIGDSASVSASTAAGNGYDGIIVGGDAARIQSSTTSGNGQAGINVSGNSASVKSSIAIGNGFYGIAVGGDAAQLRSNRAEANGFAGGASDLSGLGIWALGYSTKPSGTNAARGNDDPAECDPAILC
jgi:hypothetical protein